MKKVLYFIFLGFFSVFFAFAQTPEAKKFTLDDLIEFSLKNNPTLKILRKNIKQADAIILQSGLLPNPELEIEIENFAGKNEFGGLKSSESTFSLSQEIILGNKIQYQTEIERLNKNTLLAEIEENENLISFKIKKLFANLVSLEKRISLNEKILLSLDTILVKIDFMVKAGKTNYAEFTRASILKSKVEIEQAKINNEIKRIKKQISFIAGLNSNFGIVKKHNNYSDVKYSDLKHKVKNNPTIKKLTTISKRIDIEQKLEQNQTIPNLTAKIGIKRLEEVKQNVFVLGVSLPLPILNRNQGNIKSVLVEKEKNQALIKFNIKQLKTELFQTVSNYNYFISELSKTKNNLLSNSKKVYKKILAGYLMGKFTFLDLIETKNNLFEIEKTVIELELEIIQNRNEIEKIIAEKLN